MERFLTVVLLMARGKLARYCKFWTIHSKKFIDLLKRVWIFSFGFKICI